MSDDSLMARLKSENKRNAILIAATEVIAERGLSAPTSAISAKARVADGSLYVYFKTKDELLNTLYREIKYEMADAMMSDFPRRGEVRHRLKHIWDRHINWGVSNPQQYKALHLIGSWDGLTEESRKVGEAPFLEVQKMMDDAVTQAVFQALPPEFFAAVVHSFAEMTIDFVRRHAKEAEKYRELGFKLLWSAIERKR